MEAILLLVIIIASVYPYFLLIKLMRLACKALKKYVKDSPSFDENSYY